MKPAKIKAHVPDGWRIIAKEDWPYERIPTEYLRTFHYPDSHIERDGEKFYNWPADKPVLLHELRLGDAFDFFIVVPPDFEMPK